ncbi:MAG: Uma2 family endonuclease [Promethearchaeota archaeon]
MTQKRTETTHKAFQLSELKRGSRINNAPPDVYDPNLPRLGRRESEPHSAEVTYIHDVLSANFPEGRAIWDLHHYFVAKKGPLKGKKIDIQFDVSFFKDLKLSQTLSSYKASKHGNRVPDLVVNVLSKSTWRNDLSENVDTCKDLGIPVYAVFSPYKVTSATYHPPFLRVFILQDNGMYEQKDLRNITLEEGENIIEENMISLNDKLPFSLGLMRLKQEHEGEQSLYRLVFIDPSAPKIFPTRIELIKKVLEEKDKELEEKDKELEEKDREIERLKVQLKKHN